MTTAKILVGDCRVVMEECVDSESVDCVVTSPPYWGLRDYGIDGQLGLEPTPGEYVEKMVAVFRDVWRVLKKDGTVWLNLGDSYAGSGCGPAGESAKVGATKSGAQTTGRTQGSLGALKPKDLVGIPWRIALSLQADGWWIRSDIIWSKPNPMPESVTDRPTKSHEYVFLLTKSERYYYDANAIKQRSVDRPGVSRGGSLARAGNDPYISGEAHTGPPTISSEYRNRRTVWEVATQPFSGAHFATFPEKLVEPCILAGCPRGGTVLDPFAGSGTVGVVAVNNGRNFIGIELNPEYAEMARQRIDNTAPLFVKTKAR